MIELVLGIVVLLGLALWPAWGTLVMWKIMKGATENENCDPYR